MQAPPSGRPLRARHENLEGRAGPEPLAAGFGFATSFDHIGFWDMRVAVAEDYRSGRV